MKVIVCNEVELGGGGVQTSVIQADEQLGILTQLKCLAAKQAAFLSNGSEKAKVSISGNEAIISCGNYTVAYTICDVEKSKTIEEIKEKRDASDGMVDFTLVTDLENMFSSPENLSLKNAVGDVRFLIEDEIDNCGFDFKKLIDTIGDIAKIIGLPGGIADAVAEALETSSGNELSQYVEYDISKMTIDKISELCDIPCTFNAKQFLLDHEQEIEEIFAEQELE